MMDIKPVKRKWTLVITVLAILTMANAVLNVSLHTTECDSFCAYASAPITPDQGEISSPAPKPPDETDFQSSVGVIKNIQCSEVCCYYTLSSLKNSQILVLRGGPELSSPKNLNKKLYKGTVVKVTWHKEKIYHPANQIFETEQVIDSVEILR